MITELFMGVLTDLLGLAVSLLPTTAPPAWLDDGSGYLVTIFSAGAGLGAWVPWGVVGTVTAAVLTCATVGLGIKVVRIVASFLTVGGGSAG